MVEVGGKLQQRRFVVLQQLAQGLATLLQGQLAQVLTAEKGQVEEVVGDACVVLRVERILQRLEVGDAIVVVDHHFAVEPCRVEAQVT
ncbi:hypothetical protein D3C76_922570 [compost metagenome]